jgi:ATP phosphoribosyltransferase regulatory subunit HisZ
VQDQAINSLASRLEQYMGRYGYEKIETPIIQPAELFLTKAGDQIINRLFTFERLGNRLALRPEFTALAAHTYITQYPHDHHPVIRWQFGGSIFEDASNDYQRFSIGGELIGMHGAGAEAEIVALAALGAVDQGLAGWNLVIGHVQLMRLMLERYGLDSRTQRFLLNHLQDLKQPGKAYVLDMLDQLLLGKTAQNDAEITTDTGAEISTQQMLDALLDATQRGVTMGGRTRHDIVRRLLEKRQRAAERPQVVAAVDFLERWGAICAAPAEAFALIESMIAPEDAEAQQMLGQWREVITLLESYGISAQSIQIQPGLARNWDYYTGLVFELWSENGYHFGGGGRYDELTRLIGGRHAVPAVGFAYYVDELRAALPEKTPPAQRVITISTNTKTYPSAIRWAQALRARGHAVVLLENAGTAHFLAGADGTLQRGKMTFTDLELLLDALEAAP